MVNAAGSLAGRRVLVTGASGFLGAALVDRLLAAGANVQCVSRHRVPAGGGTWHQVALGDVEATTRMVATARPEVVFHLAGATSAARDLDLVAPMLHANLAATVGLLAALVPIGPHRVVLAGSLEAPAPTDPETVPTSPYAMAKWASQGYGRMFHQLYELPVTSLRLAMVYGPGQRDRHKLIPYVIGCLLEGSAPELTSGTRMVDWIYIDDVVEALLAAAVAPQAPGAVLDIGCGSTVSVAEVVEALSRTIRPGAELRYGARPDRRAETGWAADISAAARVLGWHPTVDLDVGLARTVRWYRELRRRGLPADTGIPRH